MPSVTPQLREQFFNKFVTIARARVKRGRELLQADSSETGIELGAELHALAGEASLLGFQQLATLALSGEVVARAWARDELRQGAQESARSLASVAHHIDTLDQSSL